MTSLTNTVSSAHSFCPRHLSEPRFPDWQLPIKYRQIQPRLSMIWINCGAFPRNPSSPGPPWRRALRASRLICLERNRGESRDSYFFVALGSQGMRRLSLGQECRWSNWASFRRRSLAIGSRRFRICRQNVARRSSHDRSSKLGTWLSV